MTDKNQLVVAPTPVADYLSVLTVIENGVQVQVPVNAENNKIKSQLVAAKLRKFMDEQLDLYSKGKKPLPPAFIKDLISSAAKVEDLARFAYANLLSAADGGEPVGTTAMQMMKAAAEGMTAANLKHNSDDRMKRITELGKKKEPLKSVEIVAE